MYLQFLGISRIGKNINFHHPTIFHSYSFCLTQRPTDTIITILPSTMFRSTPIRRRVVVTTWEPCRRYPPPFVVATTWAPRRRCRRVMRIQITPTPTLRRGSARPKPPRPRSAPPRPRSRRRVILNLPWRKHRIFSTL